MLFVQRVFPVAVGRLAQRFAGIAPDTMGRPHLAADVPGVNLVHHISKWGKLIFAVIAVYAVIHRNETDIVFREEGVCVVSNTEIISAKPGYIFLCQVGTKKILRIYKPFIGGQPPVNGLHVN